MQNGLTRLNGGAVEPPRELALRRLVAALLPGSGHEKGPPVDKSEDLFRQAQVGRRMAMGLDVSDVEQPLIGCEEGCTISSDHAHVVVGLADFAEDQATGELLAVRHRAHSPF